MSVMGSLRLNGQVASSVNILPPGSTNFSSFSITAGDVGGPVAGQKTWTYLPLVDASALSFIIVNNNTETLNKDFTFNSATGTITRPYDWQTGDVVSGVYKSAT